MPRAHTPSDAKDAPAVSDPRLSGLLETIPGFIWTADASGEIQYISPRFQAFVGRDEAGFKQALWPEFVHPDDLPVIRADWQRVNALRIPYRITIRFLRYDGVWRWVSIRADPQLDAGGNILSWYGYAEDQHEQKETADALLASEARFRELAEKLHESNRLKDEFLATLAHELRNPLAPIRNALQLMKMAPEDLGTAANAREMMERQLVQIVRLIDDLLDLSRVSRGIVELRRARLPLAVALRDAIETSRPLIEQSGHVLTVDMPDAPLELEADSTRIVQIFANLLNNAAKFTPRGGHIELELAPDHSTMQAVVTVRDNGAGVPPDMRERIFDMFMQVDRSHAQMGGGLGIGLTLVRQLAEMHGGSVEARSAGPGAGAEFVVRLPLAPPAARLAADRGSAGYPQATATEPRRILVADDNIDAAESLSLMLQLNGHETRTAHDGRQALAIAQEFRPEVMVLDIAMPELDGHGLARMVREQPWGHDVLLVAASGWGQPEDLRHSLEAGFDHHLVKPIEFDAIEALLRAVPNPKVSCSDG